MSEQQQAHFEGWAAVEVMGHQRHVGYVRTEAYGAAVLFRVDVPELPEREYELTSPEYVEGRWTPPGSKVRRPAVPGHSVMVGAGSIYRITPCDEAAALKALERTRPELKLVSVAADKALPEPQPLADPDAGGDDEDEDDEFFAADDEELEV